MEEQYPRRCANAGCEAYEENTDFDRGFMVAGLWSHGKLVYLDGMINNIDWAVGVRPETHWMVDLYKDAEGAMAPVRFGAGRFIGRRVGLGGGAPSLVGGQDVAIAAGEPIESSFACFLDLSRDYAAHLANIPEGTAGVREAINFPEGPIRYGAPRPDSSGNGFCLSCHTAEGKDAMGLDALAFRPDVMAEDDPRRRPMQPPRRVFGNIPAAWLEGGPAEAMVAPPEGVVIDRWLLPPAP